MKTNEYTHHHDQRQIVGIVEDSQPADAADVHPPNLTRRLLPNAGETVHVDNAEVAQQNDDAHQRHSDEDEQQKAPQTPDGIHQADKQKEIGLNLEHVDAQFPSHPEKVVAD